MPQRDWRGAARGAECPDATTRHARHCDTRFEAWPIDHNEVRPHSSLGKKTPASSLPRTRGQRRDLHISTQSTARRLLGFQPGVSKPGQASFGGKVTQTPIFRQISSTGVPASPWPKAILICSSVNRLFLIGPSSRPPAEERTESYALTRASSDQISG